MTHVIFAHPHHDLASAEFAAAIAAFCQPGDSAVRVDENVYAPKGSPDAIYLAAFTDFGEPGFKRLVHSIAWFYPWGVAAFIRRSDRSRFEPFDLEMEYDIGRNRKLFAKFGWDLFLPQQQTHFLTAIYPLLLERRRELILDSTRNPNRHFNPFVALASISTQVPWVFECRGVSRERRYISSHRQEFGPDKDDWKYIKTEHRVVNAELAFHGIYTRLMCDAADVGTDIFEQLVVAMQLLTPGDSVRIDGVVDIKAEGGCFIEKVRRLEPTAGALAHQPPEGDAR